MTQRLIKSLVCDCNLQQLRAKLQRLENRWGFKGWISSTGERLVLGEYPFTKMVYRSIAGEGEHMKLMGMLDWNEGISQGEQDPKRPTTRASWVVYKWRASSMRPEYHPVKGVYTAGIEAYEEGSNRTLVDFFDAYDPDDPKRERLPIGPAFEELVIEIAKEVGYDSLKQIDGAKSMNDFTELRTKISRHFDLSELRELVFDLAVSWDELEGNTKQLKILSLITYLDRRGRLEELIKLLQVNRPHVVWTGTDATGREAISSVEQSITEQTFETSKNQYHSCFISYSSQDSAFAEKLYSDLKAAGVTCWFAPEDLPIGAKTRPALDTAVLAQNKLLLILSQSSVASDWVEQEVETAFAKERQTGVLVLFPIRLDDAVFALQAGWAAHIKRTRNIGDFRNWLDEQAYQKVLQRILRDLKV
jgi:hypothetical protein